MELSFNSHSTLGMRAHLFILLFFSPEVPTKKRVERWAISLEDVVIDPLGVQVRDSRTRELRGTRRKEDLDAKERGKDVNVDLKRKKA